MKSSFATVALVLALACTSPAEAQPFPRPPAAPDPRPDLVITQVDVSTSRVVVGETFKYSVTAKNIGLLACNRFKMWLLFPSQTELARVDHDSNLDCDREVCTAPPWFLLLPQQSVSATYTVRAVTPGQQLTATAQVDPGNTCSEASESNNSGTSAPVEIFRRPRLVMSLNRPLPAAPGRPGDRGPRTQIFPVTIKNEGEGPARSVVLAIADADFHSAPTVVSAYIGELLVSTHAPPTPVEVHCQMSSDGGRVTALCPFNEPLLPQKSLQLKVRFLSCSRLGIAFASRLSVAAPDDVTHSNHWVSLHWACGL
jgi:hypothetical protein